MTKPLKFQSKMSVTQHNNCLHIMDAAAYVDAVAFGFQRPEHLGDLRHAFGAAEDGAYNLAGLPAAGGADRAVALGLPAFRQVRNLDSVVVGANPQAVVLEGALGRYRLDLY